MDNLEILKKWAEFSEYDPTQKQFYFGSISYETHRGNQLIESIHNNFDQSGTISVLYAKWMFQEFIKEVKTTFFDLFNNTDTYNEVKEMWDIFNSDTILAAENTLIHQLDSIVSKVIQKKQIGEIDYDTERDNLFNSLANVIQSLNKCHQDVYLKGGDIGKITNFSTHIHIFPNIAQCVLTLEGSKDGMYLCYIDNNQNVTGFFGFFIKSNGTIFSVSERLIEAYAGQHKGHRNARYSEGKQYALFPYDFIFKFSEYDYRGYATKHTIDDDNLAFFELGSSAYLPILLAMLFLTKQFENKSIDAPEVYIDALMPVNFRLTSGTENALVAVNNSQLLVKNQLDIEFTTEGIMSNEYSSEFSRNGVSKNYYELGQFEGYNQIFVDTYGEGFEFRPDDVFEANKHLKLLPSEENWPKDVWGNKKVLDVTPNDQLVGTKEFMRLQAYYQARKQLADYIQIKIDEAHEEFGVDRMNTWFPENLMANRIKIQSIALEAERLGLFNNPEKYSCYIEIEGHKFFLYKNIDYHGPNSNNHRYIHDSKILNKKKDEYKDTGYYCSITNQIATIWYTVQFQTWESIEWLFGEIPKILKGWTIHGIDGFKIGNSILSVVDPVSRIITPFQHRGSFTVDKYAYDFTTAFGFTKKGLNSLLKTYEGYTNSREVTYNEVY